MEAHLERRGGRIALSASAPASDANLMAEYT